MAVPKPESNNKRFRFIPLFTKMTPAITPKSPATATSTAAPKTGSSLKSNIGSETTSSEALQ